MKVERGLKVYCAKSVIGIRAVPSTSDNKRPGHVAAQKGGMVSVDYVVHLNNKNEDHGTL